MKFRHTGNSLRSELQLTPLIDIVFLLLIFFVMTFQIAPPEGEFSVKMTQTAPGFAERGFKIPAIPVRLTAGPDGELAGIRLGDRPLASLDELHELVMQIVSSELGPGSLAEAAEVELDVDQALHYRHVIGAVTAVSGHVDPQTGDVLKLVQKIRFAPARR